MKLRWKLLFMCLGCTLLALSVQTFLFQVTTSRIIYNRAKEESLNSLQNMQNELYGFIKRMESNLIEIYDESEYIQALKDRKSAKKLKEQFYRKAYEVGTSNFETSDKVVALYLYTPGHELVSTYRRAVTPKHNYPVNIYEDIGYTNGKKVQEYVESGQIGMLVSSYYNKYREADMIRFVLKLYDSRNYKESIGYVVCDVDGKAFRSVMEKYSADKSAYIWLQPENDRKAVAIGDLSDDEEEEYREITKKISRGIQLEKEAQAWQRILEPSHQEFFQVEQNKYNLTAYSLMPRSLLEQNQKAMKLNLAMIGIMMVGAAALLAVVLSRILTVPLVRLTDTIENIKKGDTSLRVNVQNRDEIGILGRNFNEMLDGMEELKEKEKRTNELLSQAKYKALQAQINPHFLYNTLDTMSSIAQLHNCYEVSMLSQSLSNIFRYSLNMQDSFSTISGELVHLKNYCYVMGIRMQDHVKYVFDIDEEALLQKIPRLSLQPLAENALNHGLRNMKGDKCMTILVKCAERDKLPKEYLPYLDDRVSEKIIIIGVLDNGTGMDARKYNERLQRNDINDVEQGNSIGMFNINARLKMLYGEQYGLWIISSEGKGTGVYISIPWKEASEG